MDHDFDDLSLDDLRDLYDGEVYFRTCGKCGARTSPRWSESACLEEARRYGWRRVAASDRRRPADGPLRSVCGGSGVRPSAGSLGVVTSPAGDVDYARYGAGYAGRRRTDPRIAALVHQALGTAATVLNVGAGAGSYEP